MTSLALIEKEEEKRLILRAFRHYGEKLRSVENDKKLEEKSRFLLEDAKSLEEIVDSIGTSLEQTSDDHFSLFLEQNKDSICIALGLYITDLREEKQEFWKEIGARPTLKNLENEIQFASEIKGELCL